MTQKQCFYSHPADTEGLSFARKNQKGTVDRNPGSDLSKMVPALVRADPVVGSHSHREKQTDPGNMYHFKTALVYLFAIVYLSKIPNLNEQENAMKLRTSIFSAIKIATLIATIATGSIALADDYMYSGTECMTANLSQGQLFSWNKDGITNNSGISLFVICPMTFDRESVAAIPTPRAQVTMSVYYGPNVPDGSDMPCVIRLADAREVPGPNASDDQVFNTNLSFVPGDQSYTGVGDIDTGISDIFTMIESSLTNAHLLCLVPTGSTLRTYGLRIFD